MRLIIASNRLPVTAKKESGKMIFKESIGGLATGLNSYLNSDKNHYKEFLWIGWPGIAVEKKDQDTFKNHLVKEYNHHPVFLEQKQINEFYSGFCNKTLWPLFHYFPTKAAYKEAFWRQYQEVNKIFAESILEVIKEDDVLWIHDYHLMLLPQMVRKKFPKLTIGFFLHIPFPSYELFRLLSHAWKKELLNGLLGADLVGFHTLEYAQNFSKCILKILNLESEDNKILNHDRFVKIDSFPMGIDYNKFQEESRLNGEEKDRIALVFKRRKIVLSIDRLDYTKGIQHRLVGYYRFLKRNPEWHKKVVMLMVVVPSRVELECYKKMKEQIDKLVGKINGTFSCIDWQPITYQSKQLSFEEMVALYGISDVALITPLRDGMNLIAKEYLASKIDGKGVLILSEMAGASHELLEAEIVNPHHIREIVSAIYRGLRKNEVDQVKDNSLMQERIKSYDIVKWADDFFANLREIKMLNASFHSRAFDQSSKKKFFSQFFKSEKRILLIDFDGTLVGFSEFPDMAKPNQQILNSLFYISKFPDTEVYILSGRDRNTLDEWFTGIPVNFIAEHGSLIKRNGQWNTLRQFKENWKEIITEAINQFKIRLLGSFIEEKEFSLVWHFRNSDIELSNLRKKELMLNLQNIADIYDLEVQEEIKSIEIRNRGLSKKIAIRQILNIDQQFIACFGDDHSDEEIFESLPKDAFSFKVGLGPTKAKYILTHNQEVEKFLKELSMEMNNHYLFSSSIAIV